LPRRACSITSFTRQIVRQSPQEDGDDALAEPAVACVPYAANHPGRHNDRPNPESKSKADVRDQGRRQGSKDDRYESDPKALLAPGEVTAADPYDTHRSGILS